VAWRNIDIDQLTSSDLPTRGRGYGERSGDCAPSQDGTPAEKDVGWRHPQAQRSHTSTGNDARNPRSPSTLPSNAEQIVRLAAQEIVDLLRLIDRGARHAGRTVPTNEERDAVATVFWEAIREFAAIGQRVSDNQRVRCAIAAREVLNPWLLRSDYWSRSCVKPHGYAGDFRMLEWMYDLESDPCGDPTKPAVVNLLDYLYSTVHSVRAVWHRRRWYAKRVNELCATKLTNQPVRILDIACGGSRYLRDSIAVASDLGSVELTFLDQDPAALAFVDSWLPDHMRGSTRLICGPVRDVRRLVADGGSGAGRRFDLVISTGLFDYLNDPAAKRLLAEMTGLARPGALVAVCNFAPADASRFVKDWIVDWPLIYRDTSALRELVPDRHAVAFDRSPDGGLVYALVWAPGAAAAQAPTSAGRHVTR
jgi:SAM-dependent methyltransferase